jgi:acid phosphatase (class A)
MVSRGLRKIACLSLALLLAGPAFAQTPSVSPEEVGPVRQGSPYLKGYLERGSVVDSHALLPPPPAEGSAALAADVATYLQLRKLRDTTDLGKVAALDANLHFPAAAETFACALGMSISQETTPHLNMLLRRTLADAGLATYGAKDKHARTRPFVTFEHASCTPKDEAALAKDGSYPSGHAAVGWAWALVLAEIAPDRADAVLQRGYAFGQSRAVCGVHWQSDVDAGRVIGSAAVARLHSNATFRAQLAAAAKEIADAKARGPAPSKNCEFEAQALASAKHRP